MLINTLKTYASDLEEKYRLEKDNSGEIEKCCLGSADDVLYGEFY